MGAFVGLRSWFLGALGAMVDPGPVVGLAAFDDVVLLQYKFPRIEEGVSQANDEEPALAELLETSNLLVAAIARAHLALSAGGLGLPPAMLHCNPDILGFLGRLSGSPAQTRALIHRFPAPPPGVPSRGTPPHHSRQPRAHRRSRTRVGPAQLGRISGRPSPPQGQEDVGNGPLQPGWRRHAATVPKSGPFSGWAFTTHQMCAALAHTHRSLLMEGSDFTSRPMHNSDFSDCSVPKIEPVCGFD